MKKSEKEKDVQYYTKERWGNWIRDVKESKFQINDEYGSNTEIFVNMMDDVILPCLKVVSEYSKKKTVPDDALRAISSISEIVLCDVAAINEDIDMMIQSLQSSLLCALVSCECYIKGGYDTKTPILNLIRNAIDIEEKNPEQALEYISTVGARIISGESMPDILFDVPDGLVAEWLDGVDSIVAALTLSRDG